VGSEKGGAGVNPETGQAATEAAARVVSPIRLYRTCQAKSTVIDEILARLMFSLAGPHVTFAERIGVLTAIDGLIRLKIDADLLKGGAT